MGSEERNLPPGIADMAVGAFFFSLMTVGVKLVGPRIPNQEIVLVRGALTLGFTWVLLRRARAWPWGNNRPLLVLRGLLGFAALTFMYYAMVHLPLAEATVLQYMNPIWAALLAVWFLGERLRGIEMLLVIGSLLGVLMIARPQFLFGSVASSLDPLAVAAGLAGAACSGAAYVAVRQLSRTDRSLVIVFYFPLVTVLASLPGSAMNPVAPSAVDWAILVGIAATAQMGQLFITRGLQREEAGRATAVGYLQVPFAALWGLIFFGEVPDGWSIAGALLILGCTLALAFTRRPEERHL